MSKKITVYGAGRSSALPEFIILVKTDNAGTSGTNQFIIPTTGGGYNYNVETSEQLLTGQTGNVTLTWSVAGTYQVFITGTFPRIYFNDGGDRLKLLEVQNWGNIAWTSMGRAFFGCSNLQISATDIPNLSGVTSLSQMFQSCTSLNSPTNINSWNISNVTNVSRMFLNATSFNQNISSWNTSNITTTLNMFANALSFNQNISSWNVSNVTDMSNMFYVSSAFNQNLGSWNLRLAGITTNNQMFRQSGMSTANYTDTFVEWANKAYVNGGVPTGLVFTLQIGRTYDTSRSGGANFANAGAARTYLTTTLGWTISGDIII